MYLLDTCVALWFFEGSASIPPRVRTCLTDPTHTLYLSDVSLLEVVIKHRIGKLMLTKPPSRLMPALLRKHDIEAMALDAFSIFKLEELPLLHRDPFDRLLIAQSLAHDLTLVTPDPLIQQYDVSVLWE